MRPPLPRKALKLVLSSWIVCPRSLRNNLLKRASFSYRKRKIANRKLGWGRRKIKGVYVSLECLCSLVLVLFGWNCWHPFFIEGPPLDLIKVSLGYAAMLERNMHHGPFMRETVALKRDIVYWGYPSIFSQLSLEVLVFSE